MSDINASDPSRMFVPVHPSTTVGSVPLGTAAHCYYAWGGSAHFCGREKGHTEPTHRCMVIGCTAEARQ